MEVSPAFWAVSQKESQITRHSLILESQPAPDEENPQGNPRETEEEPGQPPQLRIMRRPPSARYSNVIRHANGER